MEIVLILFLYVLVMKKTHTQNKRVSNLYTFFMHEAEGIKQNVWVEQSVKGVNNNRTNDISWPVDMTQR
jgi:hypothetical protein